MNGVVKYYANEDAFANAGTPLGTIALDHTRWVGSGGTERLHTATTSRNNTRQPSNACSVYSIVGTQLQRIPSQD